MKMRKSVLFIDLVLVVGIIAAIGWAFWYYNSGAVSFSPAEITEEKLALFTTDTNVLFISDERYELYDGLVIRLKRGMHEVRFDRGEYEEVIPLDLRVAVDLLFRDLGEGRFSAVNANANEYNVIVQNPEGGEDFYRFSGGGA